MTSKAIIDVDIDPQDKMGKFKALFDKFKAQLDTMPDAWSKVGEQTDHVGAGFAAMTAALVAQFEIMHEQESLRKQQLSDEEKAEKKKREATKAQEKAESAAAARRKKAIDDTKKIAGNIADATRDMLKWAAFDLAGGAVGLWGAEQFLRGIGDERRNAQGLGVSTGEKQALQVNMQRYFDVNSNLEQIANAQQDVTRWGDFARMGVNPQGKDPAQLALEMAMKVHDLYQKDQGNWTLGQAQGVGNFYSQDEWRRLGTTDVKDLRRSIQATTADFKNFGLSDNRFKVWQDFMVSVDHAGMKIRDVFIDKLYALERNGALDKIVNGFEKLAIKVFDRIDFEAIGKDLDKWATAVEHFDFDKFGKDLNGFIHDFEQFATWMHHVLVKLGVLHDPAPPPQTAPPSTTGMEGLGNNDPVRDAIIGGGAWVSAHLTGSLKDKGQRATLAGIEKQNGLPSGSLMALYGLESAYGRHAGLSSAGASGPFQFMKGTAGQYGVTNRADFGQESVAAGHYFKDLMKEFGGNLQKALAAYNWGQSNLEKDISKHGGDWLRYAPRETQSYVARGTMLITLNNQTGANVATTANGVAQ